MENPQRQDNRLPPPHTLIIDFTMTHVRYGCSHLHPIGHLTHTLNRPDPIVFFPLTVDTSVSLYDDFIQRESSALVNELPEESDQFRSLRTTCLPNLKGSVGLILTKSSTMSTSIPLDL